VRVIHGVIVVIGLGVLCAACERGSDPGPIQTDPPPVPPTTLPACPTNQPVKVTFDENDDNKCEILDVAPDNVPVCAATQTITWTYVNNCGRDLKVKVGKHRRKKYGKYKNEIDPLVTGGDFETLKPLAPGASVTASATVKPMADAPDGLYKYDLEGQFGPLNNWKVDPEIDVRRKTVIFYQPGQEAAPPDEQQTPPSASPEQR
jgi:hypothetical protein